VTTDEPSRRTEILTDLIELRKPVPAAVEAASALAWDEPDDLVVFTARHVRSALKRLLAGEFSADELEEWAELIQGREDIELKESDRERIVEFLVEASTPELFGELTRESATAWLRRLGESDSGDD
jgi:hypothetical protein